VGLTDYDRYLFAQGTHRRAHEKLGAHVVDGGVEFAVWAPLAAGVSVVGDFNNWEPGVTSLTPNDSGVWEGFVPGVGPGALYKFAVLPAGGAGWAEKTDPYAFASELRPATASVVAEPTYVWNDGEWMERRNRTRWEAEALSIYEMHFGSWRRDPADPDRFLGYREVADDLVAYLTDMRYTHVEFLPLAEHPLDRSWGYQVTGYFAPTARFGPPDDLRYLIDRCHQAGIGVFLDWVPAHFPRDTHALARFTGFPLYEHGDPRLGEHPDWGTLIFDLGRPEVRSFLISNAVFWLSEYHVDGLRVDAVASMLYRDYSRPEGQWLPNQYGGRENIEAIEFFRQLNDTVHEEVPGAVMVAEESTAWPSVTRPTADGGLGFDFKWDMGWMHDTLRYLSRDPVHRRYHQNELTFSMMYAFSERFILPLSHDEVVHGKRSLLQRMPGDAWQRFANLRLLFAYMWTHPGKKLLFMGGDIAQEREWDFEQSVDWHLLDQSEEAQLHRGIQALVRALNDLYVRLPALHELDTEPGGFEWIDLQDAAASVVSYRRTAASSHAVIICNFTPVARGGYRIGLPGDGRYRSLLSTDAPEFGGSGVVPREDVEAEPISWHGLPYSAVFTLPPLGALILGPIPGV